MSEYGELGRKLSIRLADCLAKALDHVVPPGTLGRGMKLEQSNDVQHRYDPSTGILQITGVTKIEICRTNPELHD